MALDGRTALVTGGGRGIGRAIAVALAADGARVAVLARSGEQVRRVAAELGGVAVVGDVTKAGDVAEALAQVGEVDVLVNNAGVVWPVGRTAEVDPDEWVASVDVNLVGAFRVTRAVLPAMLRRNFGRILNVTSGAASPPGMPSASAYSVGKAALEMLTAALARELTGTGVTVNALRPGVVDTDMQDFMRSLPQDQVGEAFHSRFHGLHERGELVDPAVPAQAALRLIASDRNGEVIDVRQPAAQALLTD